MPKRRDRSGAPSASLANTPLPTTPHGETTWSPIRTSLVQICLRIHHVRASYSLGLIDAQHAVPCRLLATGLRQNRLRTRSRLVLCSLLFIVRSDHFLSWRNLRCVARACRRNAATAATAPCKKAPPAQRSTCLGFAAVVAATSWLKFCSSFVAQCEAGSAVVDGKTRCVKCPVGSVRCLLPAPVPTVD